VSRGKKYKASAAQFDREELYSAVEAVDLVKATAKASFDETIEVAVRLGVDPARPTRLSGARCPARGHGADRRVVVFAAGEKAADARKAGAAVVGADDLVARVKEGFLDFDIAIATPDQMGQVGTLGRGSVLGPHAQPQDGHGDRRCRDRRSSSSKVAGSSTGPTRWATSTCASARRPSIGPNSWRTSTR